MFRKKHSTDEDWNNLWVNAKRDNPFDEIVSLRNHAIDIILKTYNPKNTVIGWTGGKDSLVLQHMCDEIMENPVYVKHLAFNEYPSFNAWCYEHAPKNIYWIHGQAFNYDFLNKHPDYLFPVERRQKDVYVAAWRKPTREWMVKHGYNRILTAKRIQDGNVCGALNEDGCPNIRTGFKNVMIDTLSPMAEWTHSQLFAYIQYYNIILPPRYFESGGFKRGTNTWVKYERVNGSYKDTFDIVTKLDPGIIPAAYGKLDYLTKYVDGTLEV